VKNEVSIANGVAVSAETENADVGGLASNRIMLRLKVKFYGEAARPGGLWPNRFEGY
jgi:hypothetical protein